MIPMMQGLQAKPTVQIKKLPSWFKQEIPDPYKIQKLKILLEKARLHTVCQSALCPNLGQCWQKGVATFMILGDVCTRTCRFCNVTSGIPLELDLNEPCHVAEAVQILGLSYVVITSVTRDDLPDQGCGQFVRTVQEIRRCTPLTKIELLIPDMQNSDDLLKGIADSSADVIGHNIEVVERLFPSVRPQAGYRRSLSVLEKLKKYRPERLTKSGFMLGLGETKEEVIALLEDLSSAGCDLVTIGQYLSPGPSQRHLRECRFVPPQEFDLYKEIGLEIGFKSVMSAPLVRSSYLAEQSFQAAFQP